MAAVAPELYRLTLFGAELGEVVIVVTVWNENAGAVYLLQHCGSAGVVTASKFSLMALTTSHGEIPETATLMSAAVPPEFTIFPEYAVEGEVGLKTA